MAMPAAKVLLALWSLLQATVIINGDFPRDIAKVVKGLDWKQCGQVGALCGAIKIEHSGTQSHQFTMQEFADRYNTAFGEPFPVA